MSHALCLSCAVRGQTPAPITPAFDPKAWLRPLDEEATLGRDDEGDVVFRWTPDSDSAELQLTDDPLKMSSGRSSPAPQTRPRCP